MKKLVVWNDKIFQQKGNQMQFKQNFRKKKEMMKSLIEEVQDQYVPAEIS